MQNGNLKLKRLSIQEFLARLGSAEPVPGGGGASALAAALGAALGVMVASIMERKLKNPGERTALTASLRRLKILKTKFEQIIERDARVYQALMGVYRRTRTWKNRKHARMVVDRGLKRSFAVPYELALGIRSAEGEIARLKTRAGGSIANDLIVGAALLKGAWTGAYRTADINVRYVNDMKLRAGLRKLLKKARRRRVK